MKHDEASKLRDRSFSVSQPCTTTLRTPFILSTCRLQHSLSVCLKKALRQFRVVEENSEASPYFWTVPTAISMLQDKLAEFQARRKKYGPLPRGTAPVVSSFEFRGDVSTGVSGEETISMEHRWSREARAIHTSTLKAATKTVDPSSMLSLGTARPASIYLPFERLSLDVQDPHGGGVISLESNRGEAEYDLDIAMNYGFAAGSAQLLRFVTEHVELVHDPPYSTWSTALTCGTTSALDIVLRMLCDRGDAVLVEEHTYSGTIEAVEPLGIELVGLKMDMEGLIPESIEGVLKTWDCTTGRRRPKVLYTIPSGQNPTGVTQTRKRRAEIYAIAEKYDLFIIEDDPYHFLQLGGEASSPKEYLQSLPASYLSQDRSGRVIRLDSTSKILAPGLRLGWMIACSDLISKFLAFADFSVVAPSGPSQIILYKILDKAWGHEGFLEWLMKLCARYSKCRDTLISACEVHLPPDLCRWTVPSCGMFLWVQIEWRSCFAGSEVVGADGNEGLVNDIEERIYTKAKAYGVKVSKGSWFRMEKSPHGELAFRLTFAAASEDVLDEAVGRFSKAVKEELGQ